MMESSTRGGGDGMNVNAAVESVFGTTDKKAVVSSVTWWQLRE